MCLLNRVVQIFRKFKRIQKIIPLKAGLNLAKENTTSINKCLG